MEPKQVQSLRVRVYLGVMAVKGYSTLIIRFSLVSYTGQPLFGGGGIGFTVSIFWISPIRSSKINVIYKWIFLCVCLCVCVRAYEFVYVRVCMCARVCSSLCVLVCKIFFRLNKRIYAYTCIHTSMYNSWIFKYFFIYSWAASFFHDNLHEYKVWGNKWTIFSFFKQRKLHKKRKQVAYPRRINQIHKHAR